MSLVDDLIGGLDDILSIRDELGAALKQVYFVTRTFAGTELGDGDYTETREQMLPSPKVVEFKLDTRIREGGNVKAGDIMLKMISKNSYPTEASVDCSTSLANQEKFYELDGELYRCIGIGERLLTWSAHLRRVSDQVRT